MESILKLCVTTVCGEQVCTITFKRFLASDKQIGICNHT